MAKKIEPIEGDIKLKIEVEALQEIKSIFSKLQQQIKDVDLSAGWKGIQGRSNSPVNNLSQDAIGKIGKIVAEAMKSNNTDISKQLDRLIEVTNEKASISSGNKELQSIQNELKRERKNLEIREREIGKKYKDVTNYSSRDKDAINFKAQEQEYRRLQKEEKKYQELLQKRREYLKPRKAGSAAPPNLTTTEELTLKGLEQSKDTRNQKIEEWKKTRKEKQSVIKSFPADTLKEMTKRQQAYLAEMAKAAEPTKKLGEKATKLYNEITNKQQKLLQEQVKIEKALPETVKDIKNAKDFEYFNSQQKNLKPGKGKIEGAFYPSLDNLASNKITHPKLRGIMFRDDNGKMKELNGRSFGRIAGAYEQIKQDLFNKGEKMAPEVRALFEQDLDNIYEALKESIANSTGPFTEAIKAEITAQAWNESTQKYEKYEYANNDELFRRLRGDRTVEEDIYGVGDSEFTYYMDENKTSAKHERAIENAKEEAKKREAEIEAAGIENLNKATIKEGELSGESKLFGEKFQEMVKARDEKVKDYVRDILKDMLETDNNMLEEDKPNTISLDSGIEGVSGSRLAQLGIQKTYNDADLLMEKEDALDAIAREEEYSAQTTVEGEEGEKDFTSLYKMAIKRFEEVIGNLKKGASKELLDFIYALEQSVDNFKTNLVPKGSTQEFSESINRMARLLRFSNTVDTAIENYAREAQVAKEEVYKRIFEENPEMKSFYEESQKASEKFNEAGGLKNLKKSLSAVLGINSREIYDIDAQLRTLSENWLDNIENIIHELPSKSFNEYTKGRGKGKPKKTSWAKEFRHQMTGAKDEWQQEAQMGLQKLPYGVNLGTSMESLTNGIEQAQKLLGEKEKELQEDNKKIEEVIEKIKKKYGTKISKGKESVTFSKGNYSEEEIRADKSAYLKALNQRKKAPTTTPEIQRIEKDISIMEEEKKFKQNELRQAREKKDAEKRRKEAEKEYKKRIEDAKKQSTQNSQKPEENIKKEEKAIEELNKDYKEHIEKVEEATEAEKAKYVISGQLSKELDKEAEKVEETTKAYEEHSRMGARPINVEAHLNDKEHYYLDKDTGEKVQSVTQYRAKLLGKSNEQYLKDFDAFKGKVGEISEGSVLTAELAGMGEMDFEFFKSTFASSKRGTLVHRAVELLEKEGANTLEELSQEAQKELAEGVEDLTKELAKLGIDKDYINLPDYAQNYRALLNKMGITHAQASELSLGMELGGEKVAGTMDQLWSLGGGRGLITDIKTTKKMHGFDETFQLSLLKEILLANYGNTDLDKNIRAIFEEIDPEKIELAIIHLIEGKAEKIDFGSLNREELANLLQRANRGEVLTEDEQRAYSRQSQINKKTIEGASSSPVSTMRRNPLFEKVKSLIVEIDAIEKLLEDPSLSDTTKNELTEELGKSKNALNFLKSGKDENGNALGYEISEKELGRLDKYAQKYKKTTQYAMETNNIIQKRASKLKEEEAEQNKIKAIVDDVNNLMGHTTREITLQGKEAKEVSEFFNTIEDGKEVIYKKVSFVDMNGNPIGSSSYQKATKTEANPNKMFSGAFDPNNMHASMSLQDAGIKSYLEYVNKLNSQQVEVAKTERKLEDVGLSRAEKAALKENLAIQQATEQSIYNQKLGLQGNVLTYQDQNGALKSIILSDEKIVMLNKKIAELAGKQQVAMSKAKNTRLESETFFGKVALGFQNSLRNLIDYTAAYTVIGWIKQSYAEFIQVTKDLDKSLVDLQIATGATREETRKLLQEYSAMGREIGRTTTEIAAASNDWLRAGYAGAEAAQLTRASMYLSTLGMIDSAQATEYLISTLKGWKLGAEDVMGVVDKLVAVDMSAALSAGDLALAMSRANVSAQIAGSSMDNFIGYVTTVADVSQKSAESVGESMKTMYARWGNVKVGKWEPAEGEEGTEGEYEGLNDIEKVLNKINIRYRDSANQLRDYDDVMDEIGKKWHTFDQVTKNALASAIAGVRQRENALILFENWDKVSKYAKIAGDSIGTANEKMKAYDDSIEASQKRIVAGFESFVNGKNAQALIKLINAELANMMEMLDQLLITAGAFIMLWQGPTLLKAFGQLSIHLTKMGSNMQKIATGNYKEVFGESKWSKSWKTIKDEYNYTFEDGKEPKISTGDFVKDSALAGDTWKSDVKESGEYLKGLTKEIGAQEKADTEIEGQMSIWDTEKAGEGFKADVDQAGEGFKADTKQSKLSDNYGANAKGAMLAGIGSIAGSMLGASGGGNIGYAIGGEKGELVGSVVGGIAAPAVGVAATAAIGAKIGGTAGTFLGGPIGTAIGAALGGLLAFGVGKITGGIKKAAEERKKELTEAAYAATQAYGAALEGLNKIDSDSFIRRFNELSQGVDKYGRNVSLSEADYSEYRESVNSILTLVPEMVKAYDAEGNALIDRNNILEESIRLLKEEAIAKKKELLTDEQLENVGQNIYDNNYEWFNGSFEDQKKEKNKEIEKIERAVGAGAGGIVWQDTLSTNKEKYDKFIRTDGISYSFNGQAILENYEEFEEWIEEVLKQMENNGEDADYYKKFVDVAKERYKENKEEYEKLKEELQEINNNQNLSFKDVNKTLKVKTELMALENNLSDGEQLFFTDFANSIDVSNIKDEEELKAFAGEKVKQMEEVYDKISADPKLKEKIEAFYSPEIGDLKGTDYTKVQKDLMEVIKQLFPEDYEKFYIKLGIIVTDENGNPIKDANGNYQTQNPYKANLEEKINSAPQTIQDKFKNINLDELTIDEQQWLNNNFIKVGLRPITDMKSLKKEMKEIQNETESWGDKIEKVNIQEVTGDFEGLKEAIKNFNDNGFMSSEDISNVRTLGEKWELTGKQMDEALMGSSGKWELNSANIQKFVDLIGQAMLDNKNLSLENLEVLDKEMKAIGVYGTKNAGLVKIIQNLIGTGRAWISNGKLVADTNDTEAQSALNAAYANSSLVTAMSVLQTLAATVKTTEFQNELKGITDKSMTSVSAILALITTMEALGETSATAIAMKDMNLTHGPEWNEKFKITKQAMIEEGLLKADATDEQALNQMKQWNAAARLRPSVSKLYTQIQGLFDGGSGFTTASNKTASDKAGELLARVRAEGELIDKEWEAMLAKDKSKYTEYFTKKKEYYAKEKTAIENAIAATQGKKVDKDYSSDQKQADILAYQKDLIENEKALRNLNDEETQDKIDREKERLDLINDTTRATVEQREASKREILRLNQELLKTADTEEEVLQRTKGVTDAFRDWVNLYKEEEMQKISDEIFDGAITDVNTLLERTKAIKDTIQQEGGDQADISMLLGIDEEGLDILLEKLEGSKDLLDEKDFLGQYNNILEQREVLLAKINTLKDNEKDSTKEILEAEKQLKQLEEDRKSIVSEYQNEIHRYYDRKIEDIEIERDALNWQVKQEEAMLSVMEKRFDTSNKLVEAQKGINKELRSSRYLTQYLDQETRKLVFNEADYSKLSSVIKKLQKDTEKMGEKYYEDLLDLTEETIYLEEYITNEYERRLEMKEKELEIAKAELDLNKKQQELDNILAEKNVRMLVNGEWRQVANQENVRNALEAMEDAEAELEKLKREQEQEQLKNDAEAHIDSLKKRQDAYDEQIRQIEVFTRELDRVFEDYLDPIMGIGHLVEGLNRTTMPDFITAVEDLEENGVEHFKTVLTEVGEALERMVDIDTPPEDGGDDGSSDEDMTEEERILAKIEEEINYLEGLKEKNKIEGADYEDQNAQYQWANEELWMFRTALEALEDGDMATYESFIGRLDAANAKLLEEYKDILNEAESLNDTATFMLRNQNSTINAIGDVEDVTDAASDAELEKLDEIRGDIQDIETKAKEEEEEEEKSYRSYSSKSYSSGSSYVSTGKGEFTGSKTETGETLGEAATTDQGDKVYITDSGSQYVPGIGYVGTVNKNADGTTNFEGGLSLVGEEGVELGVFPRGTGILPNPITKTLWAFGENPTEFLRRAYNNINTLSDYRFSLPQINGNINNTNQNVTIEKVELNNVKDGNNFLPELNAYLRRTTKVTDNK